jgi:hypothetical protein
MIKKIEISSTGFSYKGEDKKYPFEEIINLLWSPVELKDDFSVRSIMEILSKNPEFYSVALSSSFLVDLVNEYQKIKDVKIDKKDDFEIDEIVCSKYAELCKYAEDKEFSIIFDVSGRSNSDDDSYSLTFIKIKEIIDVPLRINNKLSMLDWSIRERFSAKQSIMDLGLCDFKLIDLLKCFVYEMTFLGLDKDKAKENFDIQIKKAEKDFKEGKTRKFSNAKELFEDLDI